MRIFVLGLALFLAVSCVSGARYNSQERDIFEGQQQINGNDEVAVAVLDRVVYRLGSGDRLRVIVFGEESLSGDFVVDGSGFVSFPLIGEIFARDKTVREFQNALEAQLKDGYLNDPRVSAEVKNFRPYYILGEVRQPGGYPYIDGLNAVNAVAAANGFTYRANERTVYIRRASETEERAYPLSASTIVLPGDTIRIAERLF